MCNSEHLCDRESRSRSKQFQSFLSDYVCWLYSEKFTARMHEKSLYLKQCSVFTAGTQETRSQESAMRENTDLCHECSSWSIKIFLMWIWIWIISHLQVTHYEALAPTNDCNSDTSNHWQLQTADRGWTLLHVQFLNLESCQKYKHPMMQNGVKFVSVLIFPRLRIILDCSLFAENKKPKTK